MLLSKQANCRGIWYAYLSPRSQRSLSLLSAKGTLMSNAIYIQIAPSRGLLTRLIATIDRLLLAYAEMTIRNGDIPRSCV